MGDRRLRTVDADGQVAGTRLALDGQLAHDGQAHGIGQRVQQLRIWIDVSCHLAIISTSVNIDKYRCSA